MKKINVNYVQKCLNYKFENIDLLYQAFIRRSYSREHGGENNESLELLGDSILYLFVTKYLFERFGSMKSENPYDFDFKKDRDQFWVSNNFTEKELSIIRQKLIEGEYLAARIESMDLKDYMKLGKLERKKHEENLMKTKADLFEALLGAIAIDCNWDYEIIQNSVDYMLDIDNYMSKNLVTDDNYILLIEQWNKKEYGASPYYELKHNDDNSYFAYVTITTESGEKTFEGDGKNKTIAKNDAARKAYDYLDIHDELYSIRDEMPESITVDNSVAHLNELSQKGFFSTPEYSYGDEQLFDSDGDPYWKCTCIIQSKSLRETAYASTKSKAKMYAAFLVLNSIFGLEDDDE